MTLHQRPSLFSVELRTARWEELLDWYRNVLGLRVLVRVVDDGYALFEAGDTRLAILNRPSPGEPSQRWSLGFEVVDLDAVHERLAATDSDVTAPKLHAEGFRELITADPDGNRIRLFSWPTGHGKGDAALFPNGKLNTCPNGGEVGLSRMKDETEGVRPVATSF